MSDREYLMLSICIRQDNKDNLQAEIDAIDSEYKKLGHKRYRLQNSITAMNNELFELNIELNNIEYQQKRKWSAFIDYCNTPCWRYKC